MARRQLTAEEIEARKLQPAAPVRRPLPADEIKARGLFPATPETAPPRAREPLSGWAGAGEAGALRGVDNIPAGGLVTDVLAAGILNSAQTTGKTFPGLSRALAGLAAKVPYVGKYLPAPVAGAGATLTPQAQADLYRMGATDAEVRDPGIPEKGPLDTYREVRDARRSRTEEAKNSEDSLVKWGGRVGAGLGATASILAPLPVVKVGPIGGAILGAKGAEISGRVASGAATAGAYGAASGATDGDADLTRGDVRGVGRDVVGGGVGGAVLGGAAAGVVEASRFAWPYLRKLAIEQGTKVLGGSSDIAAATRKGLKPESVEEVFESKGIRAFDTTAQTHERVAELADEAGAMYGSIVADLEQAGVRGPEAKKLASSWMDKYEAKLDKSSSDKGPANVFKEEADNVRMLAKGGRTLGLTQSEGIKRTLQQRAKFHRIQASPVEETLQEASSDIRQAVEDAVEQAGARSTDAEVQALANSFTPIKQRAARLLNAEEFTTRAATKASQKGGGPGLMDRIVGAGTSNGNIIQAEANARAMALARRRLPSAQAAGTYALSRGLETGTISPALARMVELALNPDANDVQALIDALRRKKDSP